MNKLKSLTFFQKLQLIIFLGLIIRLMIMPFFGHIDIISTYDRAYKIAFEGSNPLDFGQPLAHLIEAIHLRIYDLFIGREKLQPLGLTIEENTFVNFNLFYFKIPYLIFDLASVYLIYLLTKGKKETDRLWIISIYFLNPVVIFATYIFGRYETFPIFFLLLAIYFIQNKKLLFSLLALGLMILTRTSLIMIVPIYVVLIGKNIKEKILITLAGIAPVAIVQFYKVVILSESSELDWLLNGDHVNYLFTADLRINDVLDAQIYPFLFIYSLLAYFGYKYWQTHRENWQSLVLWINLVFATYYIFGFYHPQYLAWGIPTLALIADKKHKNELIFICLTITIALPFYLLFWREDILMGIFRPISTEFGNKDLAGVIDNHYDSNQLADIARTVIAAAYFVFAYLNYKLLTSKEKTLGTKKDN